jgi:hypothetical protein
MRAGSRPCLCCDLAVSLQIVAGMGRFFLSGQTTCALLLGAGLLLRAHAALRGPEQAPVALETPRTRPAEMLGERAPRVPRNTQAVGAAPARTVHRSSHTRKGFAHRNNRHKAQKGGVALAGRGLRQG